MCLCPYLVGNIGHGSLGGNFLSKQGDRCRNEQEGGNIGKGMPVRLCLCRASRPTSMHVEMYCDVTPLLKCIPQSHHVYYWMTTPQNPRLSPPPVCRSAKREPGKGLQKGLPRVWPSVANQTLSPGCLSIPGFCLNLTADTIFL